MTKLHRAQSAPTMFKVRSEPRKSGYRNSCKFPLPVEAVSALRRGRDAWDGHHHVAVPADAYVQGFPRREWATVGKLAERLQVTQHGIVSLISRCEATGLVQRCTVRSMSAA